MKPLDHCNLCLSQASDAVACAEAHVFCRECCFADLLAQKAGIERQKAELEAWEREDERKRFEAREKARERVRANFERGMGLGGRVRIGSAPKGGEANGAKEDGEGKDLEAEVERLAREAEDAALAAIEAEESDGRKSKIAAFWLPDNTPEAPLGPLKAVKLQTLCHVGQAHPISRKTLLPVIFSYPSAKAPSSSTSSGNSDSKPGCPSCLREVNNATGAVLLTSSKVEKPEEKADGEEPKKKKKKKEQKEKREAICGHVVCNACAERAQKGGKTCPVCEASIEKAIPLGKEGEWAGSCGTRVLELTGRNWIRCRGTHSRQGGRRHVPRVKRWACDRKWMYRYNHREGHVRVSVVY